MAKFRIHAIICATDKAQATADLAAMTAAHTNKSVQLQYIETME
jgi:hypothetical protein